MLDDQSNQLNLMKNVMNDQLEEKTFGDVGMGPPQEEEGPVTPPPTPTVSADESMQVSNNHPTRASSRNRRPPTFIEGVSTCPLCHSMLRASELSEHYVKELESLGGDISKFTSSSGSKKRAALRYSERPAHLRSDQSLKNVLARVKLNRQERSRRHAETSVYKIKCVQSDMSTQPSSSKSNNPISSTRGVMVCPVCNKQMNCGPEKMSLHVDKCLDNQSSSTDKPADVDDEGGELDSSDDEFETYEWCGETRIRATTMLDEEGLAASGFNKITNCEVDDEDLVVDDDVAEVQYGCVQYTEADIIPCTSDEPTEAKAQSALRLAVIRSANSSSVENSSPGTQSKWTGDAATDLSQSQDIKCLICMDRYVKPLVSVQCWHVHCEECWLRTLGAKKLCPQCNLITSPSDLRKIFL